MIEDMKRFAKIHRKGLFVNAVMVCICYLHMVFSQNVGVDTERMIMDAGPLLDSWKAIGRQGLVLSKAVWMPGGYNPYFAGIVFLAGFMLLGSLLAYLCWTMNGRDDRYPYGLFMVLFSVCPVWMPQFYFALQRMEVVLGLLYATLSVFALGRMVFNREYKICLAVTYLAFGVWSFCSYQGCVAFYIGLCIMIFLMDFVRSYQEKPWNVYALAILKLIGGFAAVYLVNAIITRVFFGQGQYLTGQILWGNAPVSDIIRNILRHVKNVLLWEGASHRSVYPVVCICLAIVCLAFCMKKHIKKSVKFVFFLALAGLLATPFLLTVYMGNAPVVRSQFALQLVSAFGCMFAYGICKKEGGKRYLWARRAMMAVSVAVIWFSVSTVARLQYTDDVRYQEDVRVASEIARDIQRTEGTKDLRVIFVGGYGARLNSAAEGNDMYGVSMLGWDYTPANPIGSTARVIDFMHTLGIEVNGTLDHQEEAVELAKEMDHYPNPGYISVQDDYVIVKLSDIN